MFSYQEWQMELEKRYGRDRRERFENATVAICGLGGLGSNIGVALARAGVGKLVLIDFDCVDISNLHRQQYKARQVGQNKTKALADNLKEIAPYLQIEQYTEKITEENAVSMLKNADIICEAFDDADAKAMLVDIVLEQLPDCYLIAASGMAGFESANRIQTRRITERFYVCGDGQSDVDNGIGLVSSRVMVCAAHQAHMVLRILNQDLEV